jgi:hypothetical protein
VIKAACYGKGFFNFWVLLTFHISDHIIMKNTVPSSRFAQV